MQQRIYDQDRPIHGALKWITDSEARMQQRVKPRSSHSWSTEMDYRFWGKNATKSITKIVPYMEH